MTDEERKKRAADHHHLAMELADRADLLRKHSNARPDLVISNLLSAARSESYAALEIARMDTPHEPTRSVFFRSAATLARQASVELANMGLTGKPDAKLRAELEELSGVSEK